MSISAVPAAPLLVWPSFKSSPTGFALIRAEAPFPQSKGYLFAPDRCKYPTMLLMSANSMAESIVSKTKAIAKGSTLVSAIVRDGEGCSGGEVHVVDAVKKSIEGALE
jgi:hypothetical protein